MNNFQLAPDTRALCREDLGQKCMWVQLHVHIDRTVIITKILVFNFWKFEFAYLTMMTWIFETNNDIILSIMYYFLLEYNRGYHKWLLYTFIEQITLWEWKHTKLIHEKHLQANILFRSHLFTFLFLYSVYNQKWGLNDNILKTKSLLLIGSSLKSAGLYQIISYSKWIHLALYRNSLLIINSGRCTMKASCLKSDNPWEVYWFFPQCFKDDWKFANISLSTFQYNASDYLTENMLRR